MSEFFGSLDITKAFALYFNGSVIYNGRARSTLSDSNLLLLYKNDGSVLIHAGSSIPPRNYMGAGSRLELKNSILVCRKKRESLEINFNKIICCYQLDDWSTTEIKMSRTEHELVLELFNNWAKYFDVVCSLEMEAETTYGKIDILGTEGDGTKHVVEVKRRKASVPNVAQLKRYVDCFVNAKGYLAAPGIGVKALKYLEECGFSYIEVCFQPTLADG